MNGLVHKLAMQFFTLYSSKLEVSETYFFDIVATHNDHPSYVKHVLGRIYVFFELFRCWVRRGGSPKGLVHNLLKHFYIVGTSKIEVFETFFFDIVATQNDHPRYVKHGPYVCGFHLVWVLSAGGGGGGGAPKGLVHNLLIQFFTLGSSKIEDSETYFFGIVT